MSRPNIDQWAMSLVKATALRSTCLRRNVACVLLDVKNHVMATGYNGVASGQPHCNDVKYTHANEPIFGRSRLYSEVPIVGVGGLADFDVKVYPHACEGAASPSGTNLDGCQAVHAEQNALLQCRDVYEIYTAYVSASPCITCVKLLMNTGCARIVFLEEYPHPVAKKLWESDPSRVWVHYKDPLVVDQTSPG